MIDDGQPSRMTQKMDEAVENGEQKTETVDEICDLEK
jgi:hypothetical protein